MADITKKKELYDSSYLDRLQQSQAALDSHLTTKPGAYQSKYQGQIDRVMQNITDRKPLQYDVNGDALYQQYKDRYIQMGRQAMQDTMGQAAALTGGYGNTYAQNAGQQAYGAYMQGLTDKIPELYQLALDKYDRDATLEKEKYSVLKDADTTDYGRWGDRLNQWNTDRSYLSGRADTELSQAMSIGNTMYARLAELAAKGYTPTDDELRGAGMTREQWDKLHPAYVLSYAPVEQVAAASSGNKRNYNPQPDPGKGGMTLEEQYAYMAKNGATQKQLYNFAQEAKQNGATANDIRKWSTKYMHANSGK
ncbi:MAG: hypothetical protein SPE19_10450 [Candidatus Faecousia sp.]|nr:hypothetical protein [Candidatus Faecousia sp.]